MGTLFSIEYRRYHLLDFVMQPSPKTLLVTCCLTVRILLRLTIPLLIFLLKQNITLFDGYAIFIGINNIER